MLEVDSIPPMSEEFYQKLIGAFRPVVTKPDTTREAIMYSAGQQSVLEWITRTLKRVPKEQKETFWTRAKAAWQILRRGYAD